MGDPLNTLPRAFLGNAEASPPGVSATGTPLYVGTGSLAGLLYSAADVSDPSTTLFVADATQTLHITDKGARATDWGFTNNADPTVLVHSNTTPTTDYLLIGNHNGTQAQIACVGGTLDITAVGEVVFNEASGDVDFRIESNALSAFFNIDASACLNGELSIGAAVPTNPQAMFALLPPANASGVTTNQSYFHGTILPGGATTIPAGTAPVVGSLNIHEPNITATGTVTDAVTLRVVDAPTEGSANWAFWVDAGATRLDGTAYIGDTSNAGVTLGLTINQGAADDSILQLKSSDVAHAATGAGGAETDTYGAFAKAEATAGGLLITGLKDGDGVSGHAVRIMGVLDETAADTTKSVAGIGVITLDATLEGTNVPAVCGADENLLVIRNLTTTRFIFDAEGSAHGDVEWIAFDEHDDLALLNALESEFADRRGDAVKMQFGAFLDEHRKELQAAGIVNFYDPTAPRGMVNFSRLAMLLVGAVRQAGNKIEELRDELAAVKALPAFGG
jgi:hypothetical protein